MNTTNSVRPATIWNADNEQDRLVGLNGTVIGFSFDEYGEPSDKLREANLTVIDMPTCLEYDNATRNGYRLTSQIYCASESMCNNICNGYGGGGMYFNINGTWYLRGIVSVCATIPIAKIPACDSSNPTLFTDVTKYDKWILRYTNTTKWIKALEPCKHGTIKKDNECNAAISFGSSFLVVTHDGRIFRVPMNGGPAFTITEDSQPLKVEYDCVEGRLYWADPENKTIFSAKYDGTDKKIFISENLEYPSIAVDPLRGKLYRMDRNNKIITYNLDGSESLPRLTDINNWNSDTTVSMATGEVCYIASTTRIDCINTLSKQIRTIVSNLTETYLLTVTDEMIFWVEDNNVIEGISHHGVRRKHYKLTDTTDYIFSITAVSNVCPVFYSPCAINNGECPSNTLCLLNPSVESGKICKCTENCT
ncbi:AGAP008193-PA-like protein [Anopheles sinensis]|uniref:AGAP008193-PA-like protein n=1 Tax=Anopheles sinensis TaxID=74873 RepID=A0A084VYB7_ANOSI|nr:AGAP008193-PA-like protein [Anopheles sinensis]